MHAIEKYPELIAEAQIQLLSINTQLTNAEATLSRIVSTIDLQIAFDETLKNDTQRKAKRIELISEHPDHKILEPSLRSTAWKQKKQQIEIEKLINEFTYLKIKAREEIVFYETISNSTFLPST